MAKENKAIKEDGTIEKIAKQAFKSIYSAICLLMTSPQKLTIDRILLRTLYGRFGAIAAFAIVTGIGASILLARPQMLLVSLVGAIAFAVYIGYMEWENQAGHFNFFEVACTGMKKSKQISVKSLYTYRFEDIDSKTGIGFTLNRTEELGFMEGSHYLFCFKKTPDGRLDNQSMVHYIEINEAMSMNKPKVQMPEPASEINDESSNKKDTYKANIITMESIISAAKAEKMQFDDTDTEF